VGSVLKRQSFVAGTLWLSGAGLLTRLLGFVYRLYLSRRIGAEGLGLYQLLMPVYFLLFTLSTSGFQVGISRMVALRRTNASSGRITLTPVVLAGLLPSLGASVGFSVLLFRYADVIAEVLLGDARCASGLRILSFSLPFCSLSSCCKAYFHGIQEMTVPAVDQILEQVIRLSVLGLVLAWFPTEQLEQTCCLVVLATAVGDIGATLYVSAAFVRSQHGLRSVPSESLRALCPLLLRIALPVTGGRMVMQLLSCLETVVLPMSLREAGLSASEALGLLGTYNGMVMPILFFPSLLTGSVSANLLPLAARAQSAKDWPFIRRCIERVIRLTLLLSFLYTVLLGSVGDRIGELLYPGTEAGRLLVLLSFFCSFLYLQGTLGGLLTGFGLQNTVFLHQLLTGAVTSLSILLLVPRYGFSAFLGSYLVSLALGTILNLSRLLRTFRVTLSWGPTVLLPWLSCMSVLAILRTARRLTDDAFTATPVGLLLTLGAAALLYGFFLLLSGAVSRRDLSQGRRHFFS
jgi:stage V sporulation protein B